MRLSLWIKNNINSKILAILSINFCFYLWFLYKGWVNPVIEHRLNVGFLSRGILLYHIFWLYLTIIAFYNKLIPTLKKVVWAIIFLNCSHNIGCLIYPFPRTQVLGSDTLLYCEQIKPLGSIIVSTKFNNFPKEFNRYLKMALEGKKRFFIRQYAINCNGKMQIRIGSRILDHSGINLSPIYFNKQDIEEFLKVKKIEFICYTFSNKIQINMRNLGFKPHYRIDEIFNDQTLYTYPIKDGVFYIAFMFANEDNTPDKMFY